MAALTTVETQAEWWAHVPEVAEWIAGGGLDRFNETQTAAIVHLLNVFYPVPFELHDMHDVIGTMIEERNSL